MAKDYYSVLGINKSASPDEIKSAFRKLAKQYHPDRHKGDAKAEQKFKEINEAYEVLKDPDKRAVYDRHGSSAFENGGGFKPGGFGQAGFDFGGGDFSDLFGDFFKAAMGGRHPNQADNLRGSDLRYDLRITLEEAYAGIKKKVHYRAASKCDTCNGTGSASKAAPVDCLSCRGTGRMRMQQGFFVVETTCNTCHGSGKAIKDPCKTCNGEGRAIKDRTLVVTVPAGIENDHKIKLQGEGEAGLLGASSGDLYIFVSVASHALFKRQGADLHCKVPVRVTTATLGGTTDVPTIDGQIEKVQVESGTQHGTLIKLRSKGMPILNSKQRGDLVIEVDIEVPVKLSKRQRELLEEFEKESKADSNPKCNGFFSKVKDMWNSFTKE